MAPTRTDTCSNPDCGAPRLPRDDGSRDPVCQACGQTIGVLILWEDTSEVGQTSIAAYKAKGPSRSGGPFVEGKEGTELHRASGENRHVSRHIDHVADTYDEVIRDPSGEVVREVHEPLSQHQGRGNAKPKQSKSPPSAMT